jgi:hypothetical protein
MTRGPRGVSANNRGSTVERPYDGYKLCFSLKR